MIIRDVMPGTTWTQCILANIMIMVKIYGFWLLPPGLKLLNEPESNLHLVCGKQTPTSCLVEGTPFKVWQKKKACAVGSRRKMWQNPGRNITTTLLWHLGKSLLFTGPQALKMMGWTSGCSAPCQLPGVSVWVLCSHYPRYILQG